VRWWVFVGTLSACASANRDGGLGDMSLPDDFAGAESITYDPEMGGDPGDLAGGGPCHVVVNEVAAQGPAGTGSSGEEFIELYNQCSSMIVLSNWLVGYTASGGKNGVPQVTLAATDTIAGNGYFLLASSTYPLSGQPAKIWGAGGMSTTSGCVGLSDGGGTLVDSVCWDNAGSTPLGNYAKEPGYPVGPGAGLSLQRKQDGLDTNHNDMDFKSTVATPGAPN
jgi:hypothetical protein